MCNPHTGVIGDESQTGALPNGEDHRIRINNVLRIRFGIDAEPTFGVELKVGDSGAFHTSSAAIAIGDDAHEGAVGVNGHPLFFCGVGFLCVTRHIITWLEAGKVDLGTEAHSRTGAVDGYVPAAQDEHLLPKLHLVAQPNITQEEGVDQDTVEIGARDWQTNSLVGADRDQDGIKAFFKKVVEIFDNCVEMQINPEVENISDLSLDDVCRQTVFWNADAQHPSGDG